MTRILAIDPGSARSAWVVYDVDDQLVEGHGIASNDDLIARLRAGVMQFGLDDVVIEWMSPRGMPTSAQEFETLCWIGRFMEAAAYGVHPALAKPVHRLPRLRVKIAICGSAKANDTNIRAALIDRFGGAGGKEAAVGLKKSPGPLYGIAADEWAALAVAVAWSEGAR